MRRGAQTRARLPRSESDRVDPAYNPRSADLTHHYELGSLLGKGAFGKVHAAKWLPEAAAWLRYAHSQGFDSRVFTGDFESEIGETRPHWIELDESVPAELMLELMTPARPTVPRQHAGPRMKWAAISGEVRLPSSDVESRVKNYKHVVLWLSANEAQHRDGLEFPLAAKAMEAAKVTPDAVKFEASMLVKCKHVFVLPLLECFEGAKASKERACHYVVTVRCFGDVQSRVGEGEKCVPVQLAAKWTSQCLEAFAHCQGCSVPMAVGQPGTSPVYFQRGCVGPEMSVSSSRLTVSLALIVLYVIKLKTMQIV